MFDIELLAGRLTQVTAWLRVQPWARELRIGWFGASTGAGGALWAAAEPDADIAAIVSRGGRPDLAGPRLSRCERRRCSSSAAWTRLYSTSTVRHRPDCDAPTELVVIPGATHLIEEPGTLAVAANAARDWFSRLLRPLALRGIRPQSLRSATAVILYSGQEVVSSTASDVRRFVATSGKWKARKTSPGETSSVRWAGATTVPLRLVTSTGSPSERPSRNAS